MRAVGLHAIAIDERDEFVGGLGVPRIAAEVFHALIRLDDENGNGRRRSGRFAEQLQDVYARFFGSTLDLFDIALSGRGGFEEIGEARRMVGLPDEAGPVA